MKIDKTGRGFEELEHPSYKTGELERLAMQASAIGDYEDSFDRPGSSYLWIGEHHRLNREESQEFGERLIAWAKTGSLKLRLDE